MKHYPVQTAFIETVLHRGMRMGKDISAFAGEKPETETGSTKQHFRVPQAAGTGRSKPRVEMEKTPPGVSGKLISPQGGL